MKCALCKKKRKKLRLIFTTKEKFEENIPSSKIVIKAKKTKNQEKPLANMENHDFS